MPVLSRPSGVLDAQPLEGTATYGEALEAAVDETLATGPTASGYNALRVWGAENIGFDAPILPLQSAAFGMPVGPAKAQKLAPADAAQMVVDAGLTPADVPLQKYPDGIRRSTLNLLIDLNKEKLARQTTAGQYDGWSPALAGMLVGSVLDPTNIALAFVPVVGEARYAALLKQAGGAFGRAGVRAGAGATEGLVGAALAEPLIYAGQQQWRNDYTAFDSMLNVAGGAVFGSLLHAGAGLARDAFGNPAQVIPPAQVSRPARSPFADPDVLASDTFKAKARGMGVKPETAAALAPRAVRDDVTGFFDGRADKVKSTTVHRAMQHVAATGEPAYYVSADISNLGGLNAHVANVAEAANVHYRGLSDILERELRATGADVVPMRTGGDELGLVLVNADAAKVSAALARVDELTAEYARANGLAEIPHPKRLDEKGVGLHTGVATIEKGSSVSDILTRADLGVDASKRGLDRVGRNEASAAGDGQGSGGRAGRVDPAADRGDGYAGGAAPGVREFVAGLDQRTQAAALRTAVAQAVAGRPVDVTPAMLADPRLSSDPASFDEAVGRAQRNATQTDGANTSASRQADEVLAQSRAEPMAYAKEQLAAEQQRLKELGGEPEPVEDDLKLTTDAVKAATLCMMRTGG